MQNQASVHPINDSVNIPPTSQQKPPAKGKPNQVLPTFKLNFDKQVHLLRGYANAYVHFGRPVKTEEVGTVAKIAPTTISSANAFLLDVGLIQKNESGFVPSDDLNAFNHAFEWNPETAPTKLQGLFQDTWFAKHLLPKVMMGRLSEEQAISDLAGISASPKESKNQIKILIDFLAWVGLVRRDGDYLLRGTAPNSDGADSATPNVDKADDNVMATHETSRDITPRTPNTGMSAGSMTAGAIQFSINVKVDMSEMSSWSGEQIASFFSGLAEVMAVKAAIERKRP